MILNTSRLYPLILYTSDTHLGHEKVLGQRPFKSLAEHDRACVAALRDAELRIGFEGQRGRIIHCGDVAMNFPQWVEEHGALFLTPRGKILVCGNHDNVVDGDKARYRRRLEAYLGSFEEIAGYVQTWERHGLVVQDELDGRQVTVLVSHAPQENLWGCDFQVHGHIHADILAEVPHRPGYEWTYDSPVHFNAGADLHAGRPVTLQELADAHRRRYADADQQVAQSSGGDADHTVAVAMRYSMRKRSPDSGCVDWLVESPRGRAPRK
jgi:calcineurin-like phosphoesterase family protein